MFIKNVNFNFIITCVLTLNNIKLRLNTYSYAHYKVNCKGIRFGIVNLKIHFIYMHIA